MNILVNVALFALLTLLCHGRLYQVRPSATRLTEFYLFVSAGGVLGGAFAGLLAPHIFNGTYEYPILTAAAVLALPGMFSAGLGKFFRQATAGLFFAGCLVAVYLTGYASFAIPSDYQLHYLIGVIIALLLTVAHRDKPARYFSLLILSLIAAALLRPGNPDIEAARSFFGVHRVVESEDGKARILYHGTTLHGVQRIKSNDGTVLTGRPEPLVYYHSAGPIADAIDAARLAQKQLNRVALVGLGVGSLACYRQPQETWTFFEIDPVVVRIARNPKHFRFLSECAPDADIVIGDARLTIKQPGAPFDLLVLDAFSSDAIPAHLLTREAFESYLTRLTSTGTLIVHISNRHMELASTIAAVGRALGLVTYVRDDALGDNFEQTLKASARVVVLARNVADLGDLPKREGWARVADDPSLRPWTDDYSNLLGAIWAKKFPKVN